MTLKEDKNKIISGLYIVSTPIGNLKDITLRAIDVLKNSNIILCEDTRVSKKLLSHYEIKTRLMSNYKFNEKKNLKKIIDILNEGKIVSLISDAGTPSISDPGRILIKQCIQNNLSVIPIPGPSAVSASMSISGFSDKFYFHGFLPEKKSSIDKDLKILSNLDCSIVFFISAKKINKIIKPIKKYFIQRKIVICREITKYYEEYIRSSVKDLKEFENLPKGEITIVISDRNKNHEKLNILSESDKSQIKKLIKKLTIKDIINYITDKKDVSKKEIYNYCLSLKK